MVPEKKFNSGIFFNFGFYQFAPQYYSSVWVHGQMLPLQLTDRHSFMSAVFPLDLGCFCCFQLLRIYVMGQIFVPAKFPLASNKSFPPFHCCLFIPEENLHCAPGALGDGIYGLLSVYSCPILGNYHYHLFNFILIQGGKRD